MTSASDNKLLRLWLSEKIWLWNSSRGKYLPMLVVELVEDLEQSFVFLVWTYKSHRSMLHKNFRILGMQHLQEIMRL